MKCTFTFLVLAGMALAPQAYAQQTDSLKKANLSHTAKSLNVPEATAVKVAAILDSYKASANSVMNTKTLADADKRTKIDALIDEKNKQLSLILTEEQLKKAMPSTEQHKDKAKKQ